MGSFGGNIAKYCKASDHSRPTQGRAAESASWIPNLLILVVARGSSSEVSETLDKENVRAL
jgi:hypothetical protein